MESRICADVRCLIIMIEDEMLVDGGGGGPDEARKHSLKTPRPYSMPSFGVLLEAACANAIMRLTMDSEGGPGHTADP